MKYSRLLCQVFLTTLLILSVLFPLVIFIFFGDAVTFEEIFFHLLLSGGAVEITSTFGIELAFAVLLFIVIFLFIQRIKLRPHELSVLSIIALICSFQYLGGFLYFYNLWLAPSSRLIEQNYIFPLTQEYTFPKHKKNMVLIILESMENTFKTTSQGNLIPNLTGVQENNISFDGFCQTSGTTWTTAGLVAMTTGIPIKSSLLGAGQKILQKADSFVEVLKRNEYETLLLSSGKVSFMGIGPYASSHGFDTVLGEEEFLKLAAENPFYLNQEPLTGYGYNDVDLYRIAKKQLSELSTKKNPFFMTLMTINTHAPRGYPASVCENSKIGIYASIRCADKMVKEFLDWMKQQPFYEDTVVVIVGDHLQMESQMTSELKDKKRDIFTVFISPAIDVKKGIKYRSYTHFDLAPTILEAIGAQFHSRRFGLGTSLFSDKKTLVEQMTPEELKAELLRPSKMYNSFIH